MKMQMNWIESIEPKLFTKIQKKSPHQAQNEIQRAKQKKAKKQNLNACQRIERILNHLQN